jgi:hypothetical protein
MPALGWPLWINGVNPMLQLAYKIPSLRFGFGTQFMKFFVFNDPEWDYLKYDFANYRRDSKLAGSMLNATDPNLDAFKDARRQARAVSRLVRCRAERARDDEVLRAGAGARCVINGLCAIVHAARRRALRRRRRARIASTGIR